MRRNKRKKLFTTLFILLVSIGLGYAFLMTDLTINGISQIKGNNWNIYFDNLRVSSGSVTLSEGDIAASINENTLTDITYTITLKEPGDYYEFLVDVKNTGTIDGMIASISSKFNEEEISTENPLPNYLNYTITYEDDIPLAINQILEKNSIETYKVRLEYKKDVQSNDLPKTLQTLILDFGVTYIQSNGQEIAVAHPKSLYSVLEDAASTGTYAAKYTGAHQDSWAGNGDKDIYHWYATNNANGTAILDKNNVIFAGHCWQMIRTTDTGGVKMIYNGEAENNQCLDTRGTHVGYVTRTSQNLASDYYYGTSYEYDKTTSQFSLAGKITHGTWSETNYESFIGKYTCKSTTEAGTCATLYLVESYYNDSSGYVILLNSSSHYSQFGTLEYNVGKLERIVVEESYASFFTDSPAYVGYMYSTVYPVISNSNSFYTQDSSWTVNTSYYYSDTIDWNTTNSNQYTLLNNPQTISTLSGDYGSLVGKFVLNTTGTKANEARYIVGVNGTTLYYKNLRKGNLNTSLTIGDSYIESGGVYTLTGNVTNVPYQTWYTAPDLSIYKGKYVCDGNNTSCTTLKRISVGNRPTKSYYNYIDTEMNYSYAKSVSFDGTTYTLTGDIQTFWDLYDSTNQGYLPTHHYTCLENGTSCTTLGYVTYLNGICLHYAQLSNVVDIEAAFNNMLYASNVNVKNSIIKTGIDAWYAKYLIPYDSYIEDTIFCNNRTIKSLGGWNQSGGEITNSRLQFQEYSESKDLSCNRGTDKFSTKNNSAKLTYKVGLMSAPEINLLNNKNARLTGKTYWLMSPSRFDFLYTYMEFVTPDGSMSDFDMAGFEGVRPAISLKPGTTYVLGDGSMASPYIVE